MKTVARQISPQRAREIVDTIHNHGERIQQLLSELYHGRGWIPLGYATWRECAAAEFGMSIAHAYRLKDAGEVEINIGAQIEERSARELKALPAQLQPLAYELAKLAAGGNEPPARTVKAAVAVLVEANSTEGAVSVGGESRALLAAITAEEFEQMQRQREYISNKMERKHGAHAATIPAAFYETAKLENGLTLISLITTPDAASALTNITALPGETTVRLIISKQEEQL